MTPPTPLGKMFFNMLAPRQRAELTRMQATSEYTITDRVEVFSVGRASVYPPSSAPPR